MIYDAALAAATEQARYRYGTVGEILHPAHMFVLDRIVPAHVRVENKSMEPT